MYRVTKKLNALDKIIFTKEVKTTSTCLENIVEPYDISKLGKPKSNKKSDRHFQRSMQLRESCNYLPC